MTFTVVNTNTAAAGATPENIATETVNSVEKVQRVKLMTGASGVDGGDVGSLAGGTGTPGILVALGATEFFFSTVNSTAAQLGSGATFTGAIEAIPSAQNFSIIVASDQPGTLTVNQYSDAAGIFAAPPLVFTHAGGSGLNICRTANGNYLKVVYQNTGASASTTLNINTAYGTLDSVTTLGNKPVALNEVNGSAISLGQKTSAASLPMVPPSDWSLPAGTNVIGKVGIDQTNPGTTNGIAAIDGALATVGAKADASVLTPGSSASQIALMKGMLALLQSMSNGAVTTIQPGVTSPLTTRLYTTTGATSWVTVEPGAWYLISIGKIYTAATVAITASGGTAGTNVITTASTTGVFPGQQIVGTGVPTGAVVTAVTANTSVTISVNLTATASGTYNLTSDNVSITFQSSIDGGTTPVALPAVMKSVQSLQAPASTSAHHGLFLVQAPVNTTGNGLMASIRVSIGTLTNANLIINIAPLSVGAQVFLPQCYPNAFTQANWPTGACSIPVIEKSYLGSFVREVVTFSGTGQTFTWQQSNDPNLGTAEACFEVAVNGTTAAAAVTATGAGVYQPAPKLSYFYEKQTGTALTGWNTPDPTATVMLADNALVMNPGANVIALGAAAQGATASGAPVLTGAVAKTAQPTARTDGQIVAPLYGKVGHGVQRLGHTRDLTTDGAQVVLTTTTETTIQAAVASTFNDLSAVFITSNATYTGSPTGVRVDFRDTTAGSIRFSVNLPTAGGAFNQDLSRLGNEFKQATVNTNWTAQVAFVGGTSPAIGSGDIRITPKVVGNI